MLDAAGQRKVVSQNRREVEADSNLVSAAEGKGSYICPLESLLLSKQQIALSLSFKKKNTDPRYGMASLSSAFSRPLSQKRLASVGYFRSLGADSYCHICL